MNIIVSPRVAEDYRDRICAADREARLITVSYEDGRVRWSGDPAEADICCFSEDFWQDVDARRHVIPALFTLQNLRWFHSFSAGIDSPACAAIIQRGMGRLRSI